MRRSSSVHSAPWPVSWPSPTRRAGWPRPPPCTRSAPRWPSSSDRVLLVDLDPQACLTYSVGLDPERLRRRCTTCCSAEPRRPTRCVDRRRPVRAARDHRPRGLRGAPADPRPGASTRWRRAIAPMRDRYDVVLVDCPPSLGILTINGLTAADEVLDPAAVRDAQPPRRRPAARDRRRRAGLHAARPRRARGRSRRCSTAAPGTPARCSPTCKTRYGLDVLEPHDPEVDPLRRGARRRGGRSSSTRRGSTGRGRLPRARHDRLRATP